MYILHSKKTGPKAKLHAKNVIPVKLGSSEVRELKLSIGSCLDHSASWVQDPEVSSIFFSKFLWKILAMMFTRGGRWLEFRNSKIPMKKAFYLVCGSFMLLILVFYRILPVPNNLLEVWLLSTLELPSDYNAQHSILLTGWILSYLWCQLLVWTDSTIVLSWLTGTSHRFKI